MVFNPAILNHIFGLNSKKGTFRRTSSKGFACNESRICDSCLKIPTLDSFKKRLKLRCSQESRGKTIRLEYLNREELISKNREKASQIADLSDELFFD